MILGRLNYTEKGERFMQSKAKPEYMERMQNKPDTISAQKW